jgi:hypothetical protein
MRRSVHNEFPPRAGDLPACAGRKCIKRAALGLALSLATVLALAVTLAEATTTGTTYNFAAATATPISFAPRSAAGR